MGLMAQILRPVTDVMQDRFLAKPFIKMPGEGHTLRASLVYSRENLSFVERAESKLLVYEVASKSHAFAPKPFSVDKQLDMNGAIGPNTQWTTIGAAAYLHSKKCRP